MKTRRLGILAIAGSLLALGGCADSNEPAGGADSEITIGFSVPAVDDYYGVVRDSFVAEAERQGVNYLEGNGDGAGDPTQQIAKIETMLAQGIDVLAVAPPGEAFIPVLDRAVELGVNVIFIDQQVPDWNKQSTFIATNNPAASQQLGEFLLGELEPGDEVGIMIGIPGIPLLFDRYNNFQNVLEGGGITVTLSSETDGCQLDTAVNVIRNFIVANPDIDAIYSTCGPTGIAANQVVAELGVDIKTVTFDVPVQQINDIIEGRSLAAVAQFPADLARNAIEYALKVAAGESVPEYVDNGTEIVTVENADEFFREGSTGYSFKI